MKLNKLLYYALFSFLVFISCKTTTFEEGKRIYVAYCSNCHMEDGSGLGSLIPPLAHTDYSYPDGANIVCVITQGLEGPITVNGKEYNGVMPPATLNDVQLHNLINYINNAWGNKTEYVTIEDVASMKAVCVD